MPEPCPFQPLETSRLLLRLACPADAGEIAALVDSEVAAMTATWFSPMPEKEVRDRLERAEADLPQGGALSFVPVLKQAESGHPAGSIVGWIRIGPDREKPGTISLGYWTGAPFRRRGYIEEAVRAALPAAARHFGTDRIEAGALLRNPASLTLLVKLGMVVTEERESYSSSARNIIGGCRFIE